MLNSTPKSSAVGTSQPGTVSFTHLVKSKSAGFISLPVPMLAMEKAPRLSGMSCS